MSAGRFEPSVRRWSLRRARPKTTCAGPEKRANPLRFLTKDTDKRPVDLHRLPNCLLRLSVLAFEFWWKYQLLSVGLMVACGEIHWATARKSDQHFKLAIPPHDSLRTGGNEVLRQQTDCDPYLIRSWELIRGHPGGQFDDNKYNKATFAKGWIRLPDHDFSVPGRLQR